MMRLALPLAATLALSACSLATGPQVVARLGPDPVLDGGSYDSGGGITVGADDDAAAAGGAGGGALPPMVSTTASEIIQANMRGW